VLLETRDELHQDPLRFAATMAAAVVFVLLVGWADLELGQDVHLFVFHLLAIGFITWRFGRRPGAVIAGLAAFVWLLSSNSFTHGQNRLGQYWNLLSEVLVFFGLTIVLARLREAFADARRASETDMLTGVNNRRALMRIAGQELRRAQRYRAPVTVLYLDLDNFKMVNDTQGHPVGDALLTLVAQTIQHAIRRVDAVARLGGDEFALIMPDTTLEAAHVVASKLQRNLDDQMARYQWPVTFSIGMITFDPPPPTLTVEDMLRQADVVMYKAKSAGKNRIQTAGSNAPPLN
jgi:diguanylate cyclase (GGDEF)-like protein